MPWTGLTAKQFLAVWFFLLLMSYVAGIFFASLYKAAPNTITKAIFSLSTNSHNIALATAA